MGRKKKETMELRFYDVPQKETVLALLGEEWIREYGSEVSNLHFHNLMEIGYCRNGSGQMQLDNRTVSYEPEMISVIPKNYPHTTNSEIGKKSFWEYLFFDPETLIRELYPDNEIYQRDILKRINESAYLLHVQDTKEIVSIVLTIMDEMRNKRDFYMETVHSLTIALLYEIARLNQTYTGNKLQYRESGIAMLKDALEFISSNYQNNIRIEMLADRCGMSETHFRRIFEENMNMTPVEYINMMRIQRACEIMKKSHSSMDEIAQKVGFSATSTFNRNFKKMIGTTPYQWKKNPDNYETKLLQFNISATKGW